MSAEISGQCGRHSLETAQPFGDELDLGSSCPFFFELLDPQDRDGEPVCDELEHLGGDGVEAAGAAAVGVNDTEHPVT